jgi:hypothetical protein
MIQLFGLVFVNNTFEGPKSADLKASVVTENTSIWQVEYLCFLGGATSGTTRTYIRFSSDSESTIPTTACRLENVYYAPSGLVELAEGAWITTTGIHTLTNGCCPFRPTFVFPPTGQFRGSPIFSAKSFVDPFAASSRFRATRRFVRPSALSPTTILFPHHTPGQSESIQTELSKESPSDLFYPSNIWETEQVAGDVNFVAISIGVGVGFVVILIALLVGIILWKLKPRTRAFKSPEKDSSVTERSDYTSRRR